MPDDMMAFRSKRRRAVGRARFYAQAEAQRIAAASLAALVWRIAAGIEQRLDALQVDGLRFAEGVPLAVAVPVVVGSLLQRR